MMNREQLFEQLMKEFQETAHLMLDNAASRLVVEYLPHVASDTEFNAQQIAESALADFLAGKRSYRSDWFITSYQAADCRKKILEEYPEELSKGLVKDLKSEIASLKACLEYERSHRYLK